VKRAAKDAHGARSMSAGGSGSHSWRDPTITIPED
jgi:hypothetical protein